MVRYSACAAAGARKGPRGCKGRRTPAGRVEARGGRGEPRSSASRCFGATPPARSSTSSSSSALLRVDPVCARRGCLPSLVRCSWPHLPQELSEFGFGKKDGLAAFVEGQSATVIRAERVRAKVNRFLRSAKARQVEVRRPRCLIRSCVLLHATNLTERNLVFSPVVGSLARPRGSVHVKRVRCARQDSARAR